MNPEKLESEGEREDREFVYPYSEKMCNAVQEASEELGLTVKMHSQYEQQGEYGLKCKLLNATKDEEAKLLQRVDELFPEWHNATFLGKNSEIPKKKKK